MANENPKKAFGDKKPPLGQLPLVAQIHGALAFYDGAGKYGNRNWRENPVEAQTYVEAILRHVRLWENGEEFARDTGIHNLGGVIASAGLLLDAQANGCLIDNRVKSQAACDLLHDAEADVARLKEQHAARKGTAPVVWAALRRPLAIAGIAFYPDVVYPLRDPDGDMPYLDTELGPLYVGPEDYHIVIPRKDDIDALAQRRKARGNG